MTPRYKSYLIGLLMVAYALSQVDRMALGLLAENLKADFKLSDAQVGFLGGIAFAFFYAIMGVPIARLADRWNRTWIMSAACALWSLALIGWALAANFTQLLCWRVAAGVGEAGCVPVAQSIIADSFPREEQARSTARFMLGLPLSIVMGFFAAGWLNEWYGWRATVLFLGVPGIVAAPLIYLTLKEPRLEMRSHYTRLPLRLGEVCVTLWRIPTFRLLLAFYAVASFLGSGLSQWEAVFFIRSFGIGTGELGTWLTGVYGMGGALGLYLGGEWASRYAKRDERRQMTVMTFIYSAYAVGTIGVYLTSHLFVAFGIKMLLIVSSYAALGPLFAIVQLLVPEQMRATAISLFYLFANLIGMGLGPLLVGALSDSLRPLFLQESIRYALLMVSPFYVVIAWLMWRASHTVTKDLQMYGTAPVEA